MALDTRWLPALVLALALGCAPRQAPVVTPPAPPVATGQPAWVDQEEQADGLAAVGIAQPNPMADKAMQRTMALADARTKLAGKLKVRVQSLFTQLDQQVTSATGGQAPGRSDAMNRVLANVTRQVLDQELVGASTRATWTDPRDGSLYLLLVLTRTTADRAIAGTVKTELRRQIAQGQPQLAPALPRVDTAMAAVETEDSLNAALDRLDPAHPETAP